MTQSEDREHIDKTEKLKAKDIDADSGELSSDASRAPVVPPTTGELGGGIEPNQRRAAPESPETLEVPQEFAGGGDTLEQPIEDLDSGGIATVGLPSGSVGTEGMATVNIGGMSTEGLDTESLGTESLSTESLSTESLSTESLRTESLGTESVGFRTEAVRTEGVSTEGLGTESLGTEGIGTESLGTERVGTESVGTESLGETSDDDDADEVVVLLEDEPDESSESGWVDSSEIPHDTSEFTSEVGLSTQSLEDIGLRTVNPGEAAPGEGVVESLDDTEIGVGGTEPVGVLNEITELATSLDPDILEADGGEFEQGEVPPAVQFDDDYDDDEFYVDESRGSRGKLIAVIGSLAALIAVGVFFYPQIREWAGLDGDEGQVSAAAGSGTSVATVDPVPEDPTSTDPGTVDGGVESVNRAPRFSVTRKSVREQVFLAIELGLQWEEVKE